METFAAYGHAIVSVALYAVIAQVLNAATGIEKGKANLAPGASHPMEYSNRLYRLDRTYMNTVEMLPFYAALVGVAILAGAAPFWVNLFASLGLVFRIAANVVYLRGAGRPYGGLRTQIIILHSIANVALGLLAIWAVFVG